MAKFYEAIHRPAEAIIYFRRALDDDPHSIAALNGTGHGLPRSPRSRRGDRTISTIA